MHTDIQHTCASAITRFDSSSLEAYSTRSTVCTTCSKRASKVSAASHEPEDLTVRLYHSFYHTGTAVHMRLRQWHIDSMV
jgi:hypothetical protein